MAERGGGCGQKGLILDDAKHLKIHLDPPPHPSVLPCHSCPGPAPCLGPQLGVDADGASSAGFLTRASSSVSL